MSQRIINLAILLLIMSAADGHAQDTHMPQRAAMSRVKGAPSAPLTIYEMADFQCPYCARFSREVFPHIDSAYVMAGKARWVFVNFPLPTHANAWAAAEAAMCAGGVSDQFWAMHDKLFAGQAEWVNLTTPAVVFTKYAQLIGVPVDAFNNCMQSDRLAILIVRDLLNAADAGANGTPAFIIGGEPVFAGFKSFDEWKTMLDAALGKAPAANTSRK